MTEEIVTCPICGKSMKKRGLPGHMRFKHPKSNTEANTDNLVEEVKVEEKSMADNKTVKEAIDSELKQIEETVGVGYLCPACGKPLPEDAGYCSNCGVRIEWDEE